MTIEELQQIVDEQAKEIERLKIMLFHFTGEMGDA